MEAVGVRPAFRCGPPKEFTGTEPMRKMDKLPEFSKDRSQPKHGWFRMVGIMPVFGREGITLETLRMLREKQTIPFYTIIVLGETDSEQECAEKAGCEFLRYPNMPIGRKMEAGLFWAKNFNPDAVVILGSDTWLSPKWLAKVSAFIRQGFELVGKNEWYSMNVMRQRPIEIIHRAYKTEFARKQPVGGGRMISRELLERVGWSLWPLGAQASLDTFSFMRMEEHGVRVKLVMDDDIKVMGVKGPWPTLNRFDRLKKADALMKYPDIQQEEVRPWLDENFPGAIETLQRLGL